MSDIAGRANDYAGADPARRIKHVRDKAKYSPERKFSYTECLNCFEPSVIRFCCVECRDDYERRKSRQ